MPLCFFLPPLSRLWDGFDARLEVSQCFPPSQASGLRADCAAELLIRGDPRGLEQPGRELQSLVHPCRKAEVPRAPLPPGHSAISCLQEAAACQLHAFPLPVVSSRPHGSICTQGSISSVKYIKKNNKNAFGCFFFLPKDFLSSHLFYSKVLKHPAFEILITLTQRLSFK